MNISEQTIREIGATLTHVPPPPAGAGRHAVIEWVWSNAIFNIANRIGRKDRNAFATPAVRARLLFALSQLEERTP